MLTRRIDEQFLETQFFGVTRPLGNDGHLVNEKRIRRLMWLMGLMPIYQKPNTSRPAKGHKTYLYQLKGLRVTRPNQVWVSDITYIPMRCGFLYSVAIIDWYTRIRPPFFCATYRAKISSTTCVSASFSRAPFRDLPGCADFRRVSLCSPHPLTVTKVPLRPRFSR